MLAAKTAHKECQGNFLLDADPTSGAWPGPLAALIGAYGKVYATTKMACPENRNLGALKVSSQHHNPILTAIALSTLPE